jgi:hypothetical protein
LDRAKFLPAVPRQAAIVRSEPTVAGNAFPPQKDANQANPKGKSAA